ncbi:MAG TPA: hypothetical protein VLT61_10335, partial [Anaeromyxobacteraceae bacterium]|nr:hypothetical protein [Anaeromyxobacteraceae bacterium]
FGLRRPREVVMSRRFQPLVARALAALALLAGFACSPEREPAALEAAVAAVAPQWTRSIANAYGVQLALDPAGNVLVAGSIPYDSILLAKYDPAGTLLWQQTFQAPGTREQAAWLAVDGAGNTFVAGYLVAGAAQLPSGFVLLKYDPSGALLWSDVLPITLGQAVRVETDTTGNAYLTGKGWLSGFPYVDFLTAKYAPDGTRLWLRSHGLDLVADVPASLAVSAEGRVAVTGSPPSGWPMETVVYDTNGNVLWAASDPAGNARDVVFGPAGEVFVAGGTYALVVVKHDAAGNVAWTASAPGFSANRVGLDAAGNVFLTGIAVQTSGLPYTDWVTAKLDPAGALLWLQRYDAQANNDEIPRALAVTADGAVIVTGQGGPAPIAGNLSSLQTVTLEYSPAGALAWLATNPDALNGVGVRSAGSSVFAVAEVPMTTFRLERVAATDATSPAPAPAPSPSPSPAPSPSPPPPVVSPTMTVASITLDARRVNAAKYRVTGRVYLRDASGAAVAGATVSARWTTPAGGASVTATSDTAGVATFATQGRAGTYTLAVTGVAKAGFTWDAAASVTSRSLTVP